MMESNKVYEIFNSLEIDLPQPEESFSYGKRWINWGDDNLYPNYLANLLNKSPLHSTIVKQKAMFIGGNGFDRTNISNDGLLFIKNLLNEDDLDQIVFKIASDLELYGGYFLNIIWSKSRDKISEINYVDPSTVRIIEEDGENKFLISDSWNSRLKCDPVIYPQFTDMRMYKGEKRLSQILYVKEHRELSGVYPRPSYSPGIKWFEMDSMISDFHFNNLKEGFFPSMRVNFPIGEPSDEEARAIINRTKKQHEGATGRRTLYTFSQNNETAATFDPIEQTSSDTMFLILNEQVEKNILKSHRVINSALFGIETAGALGSRNEILESLEVFQTNYTTPKQRIIEKTFNMLRKINGIEGELSLVKYEPQFSKINTNVNDIVSILTADITSKQKYLLLIANSYDEEMALGLSNWDGISQ